MRKFQEQDRPWNPRVDVASPQAMLDHKSGRESQSTYKNLKSELHRLLKQGRLDHKSHRESFKKYRNPRGKGSQTIELDKNFEQTTNTLGKKASKIVRLDGKIE